jgi:SpoVK/Ycf46/Vps4 family AAA+-type ATPase
MPTADQVKALVRSHAEGDDTRFYAVAIQVAAEAARIGHHRFAQELRRLIDSAKTQAAGPPAAARFKTVPLVQPRGELSGLLTVSYPKTHLSEMALGEAVADRIRRVVLEHRQQQRIKEHGLHPLRKLLLLGPPGTGKTMTAAALAGELCLPLFAIQLDGLITKYMGETAAKLRLIFDAIQRTVAVYLFDEFDALGGERASKNDVGEIRRALNSFLQFLEQDESDSLIVAATNHPQLLDRAVFRRFDITIRYSNPSQEVAESIMKARLAPFDTACLDWSAVRSASDGLSHAEIAHACAQAAKNMILTHQTKIDTDVLVGALRERSDTHS